MKKLEQIQDRKIISSYGGPGSLIETMQNGSLMILPYDRWRCYRIGRGGRPGEIDRRDEIVNPLLLRDVQQEYKGVQKILTIPTPEGLSERVYTANNNDLSSTVLAKYFPEWFYCPRCRKMHRISEWETLWVNRFNNDNSFKKNPPACCNCSTREGGRFKRKYLEQIRFVMASLDTGLLKDIPFDRLWDRQLVGRTWLVDANPTPEELSYNSSQGGDGLESLYIKKGGEIIPLSLINDKYIIHDGGAYKLMIRNGTNLYYPTILKSIYIPKPTPEQIRDVTVYLNAGCPEEEIRDRFKLSSRQIADIRNQIAIGREADAKLAEFNYVTNDLIYDTNTNVRREKFFTAIRYPNLRYHSIQRFYSLPRLKETSVLMSYTRVSPRDKVWWDLQTNSECEISPKVVSPFETANPTFMPAVESYGEGLLFVLNLPADSDYKRFLFLHTLCHLLMKELEFVCGYPVSSLKERLYFDSGTNTTGFLIYTIQGSEGSYGGLTSLMPNDTNSDGTGSGILRLIEQAIARSSDCPNDPICSQESGHCFACVDLPEISCECWNNDLNRKEFNRYWTTLADNNNL